MKCLFVAAAAVFAATCVAAASDGDAPFTQYAPLTRAQYAQFPPLADWGTAPFAGITAAAADESSGRFYVATTGGALFSTGTPVPGAAFTRHKLDTPTTHCALATLAAGYCLDNAPASACPRSAVLVVCAGSVTVCRGGNCTDYPFRNALPAAVNAAAVQYPAPGAAAATLPTVVIATSAGVFQMTNFGVPAALVLTNTTGSPVTALNATQLLCLPAARPGRADATKFFGGECFVTTVNTVCLSNICPADLVHAVRGARETRFIRVPGVIDAAPTAMAYDWARDAVHFGNRVCDNVLFADGALQRLGGHHGGLPTDNLTAAAAGPDGDVWFGAAKGVAVLRPTGEWKYLYGGRWLPSKSFATGGNRVVAVAQLAAANLTLVATDRGISVVQRFDITLAAKAALAQERADTAWSHIYGLVGGSYPLAAWGNSSSAEPRPTGNDGLHTAMYLASQVFRFAATQSAEAKANAWAAFTGMELLVRVTGVPGLPARAIWNGSHPPGQSGWQKSPTMPGWLFVGDASSDETNGHLHVYPLMHDLVAETPAEKRRVAALIAAMTSNIVDNGLVLKLTGGKNSTWGVWNPAALNDNPFWYDERGGNSNEILTYLSSAYRITRNATYLAVFTELVERHGYADNMVNLKITQPSDQCYFDDRFAFILGLAMEWSGRPAPGLPRNPAYELVKPKFRTSLQRTWDIVGRQKPSLFDYIYIFVFRNATRAPPAKLRQAAADATWCAQTWPMNLIDWPVDNSERLDVWLDPTLGPDGRRLIMRVLPGDEIERPFWGFDPYVAAPKWAEARIIFSPSAYLYSFWLGRFIDLL
jgi:hypothetical protein